MSLKRIAAVTATAAALALSSLSGASAQETLKLGISAPMSGAAASWGLGFEWAAQQAADKINAEGGIKVGGKSYNLEILTYDNKYNATEGAKVAQTLLNRDNVNYIVGSLGTAPVRALQALSERKGVLLFTTAWGKSVKGPEFPLTFTQINTPFEVLPQLYGYIKQQHPDAKSVVLISPNDATGQDTEKPAVATWKSLGVEVLSSDWYERGTTEFQPIATKIASLNPDIVDFSAAPPTDAGAILKELSVLGWKGIKSVSAGTSSSALVKTAGDSAEGVYMGLAADYDGPSATPIQRELNEGARKALGEPLNVITIGTWDAIMALKAAAETADSLDPKVIAETLPKIVFESSYGPTAFGGADTYGNPQQMLLPTIVTQVQGGKVVEVKRVNPPELDKRLKN
ncbi:MAG: ABC transporter substrate-binding protein [Alphaproteobacteria bacterium]|uniref:ABC transporter substrate-binding protein n=1 Tax=Futiania mangrovi TaxID=2959716 RepID=A0A9J6PBH2_9PROT|nr:ABC transporter substrate-binding protein [Futiania mangrovii]MCP1335518.1 ABC transporter substrate-binding protein [Futiania mangrovii]MDX5362386.1 ABC transporter substrate-binding protein [Alphaproteobacteria bacterium]MDX5370666.1 ABC transporter substrate-binding protein [Alphaproteobacteria bacterium]MDX5465103.1 ABC transporter substrate-binding protein [Alphaproteobacteria bacterium]